MRIRKALVSNSSSASFIIDLNHITSEELREIEEFNNKNVKEFKEHWIITREGNHLLGNTLMDNGILFDFIKYTINPRMKAIISWVNDD